MCGGSPVVATGAAPRLWRRHPCPRVGDAEHQGGRIRAAHPERELLGRHRYAPSTGEPHHLHDRAGEPSYPGPTKEETLDALNERGLIVFGMQSGVSSSARRDIREVATATGGKTFALASDSSTIAETIAEAVTGTLSSLEVSPSRCC